MVINDKCQYECKKRTAREKDWNISTCSCENGKYLVSLMDNWVIICDVVIEPYDEDVDAETKAKDEAKSNDEKTKTVPTSFNEKNRTFKTQNFYMK